MASAADALVRASSAGALDERGTVRLTASRVVGAEVLPAILTSFHEKYPGIAIELVLTDIAEDLLKREADIAVRMVRPKQESLVAKKIGVIRLGLFAHHRYLERHGTPKSLDDASNHTLIGFDRELGMVRALRGRGMKLTRDMFGLRCDNDLAQMAALRAGFGLGVCQIGIARRDPNLVHVLPTKFSYDLDTWLCMHKDLRGTHRMRLLFDHLVAGLDEYAKGSR
jgi:DNA-binding transcriptional LysR family regulator